MRSLFFLSIFGTTLASELLQSGVQSNAKRDIDILASCDYINFWANSWIMSSCTKDASQPFKHKYYASDKFTTTSYLDLNHCIANSGGTLVARAEGNFNQSCEAKYKKPYLKATCITGNKDNPEMESQIDLRGLVVNDNGVLKCFETRGCEFYDCPEQIRGDNTREDN